MSMSFHRKYLATRSRGRRLAFVLGVFAAGYLYTFSAPFWKPATHVTQAQIEVVVGGPGSVNLPAGAGRRLLQASNSSAPKTSSASSYPNDLFNEEQRMRGAVILHIFGMFYMFLALAIVCDEFFVPSLDVITEKLGVSEDVAGATFMAAGGSAPELFTSLIGVFISKSDVGIGTIVGSAVFNILFVIGMCALFSKTLLTLTWWPLFRDVTFYSSCLIILIVFFVDEEIQWWESLVLFVCYILYGLFMKWNVQLEHLIKSTFCSKPKSASTEDGPPKGLTEISSNYPINTDYVIRKLNTHRKSVAHLLYQHVAGSADNLRRSTVRRSTVQRSTVRRSTEPTAVTGDEGKDNPRQERNLENNQGPNEWMTPSSPILAFKTPPGSPTDRDNQLETDLDVDPELSEMIANEPLDMSWPNTTYKRFVYIFLAPIFFPLSFTLPDVRRPERKICFVTTFAGSILWIAFYSYNMVWWATVAGITIGIPDEVMGLTILAAGTSIPDLITSVIVARKGFGDMALSSSVGSNLFDITVGLPVPWLIYSAVNAGAPYKVSSKGLVCSIFLLFAMLVAVVICIAVSGWRMSKFLGVSMLVLYNIFIVIAVLLEYSILKCPNDAL